MKGLQRLEYLKESLLEEAHNEWDNQQSLALSKKKPNRPSGTFESLETTLWLHHDHQSFVLSPEQGQVPPPAMIVGIIRAEEKEVKGSQGER